MYTPAKPNSTRTEPEVTTRVYLLEGADAAGKTALAEKIGQETPDSQEFVYIHNDASDSALPGTLFKHYRAQLMDALERENTVTVIDRSFLSELVYGYTFRGRSRISARQAIKLTDWAIEHGIILVGCIADDFTRQERMAERGEEWNEKDPAIGAYFSQIFRGDSSWYIVDSSSAR